MLHCFASVCQQLWMTTLPLMIHQSTIHGKDWKACPQDGHNHLQPFAARSMAIFLVKIVHVTDGFLTMIPTVSQCATYPVLCLPKIWSAHPPSSTTTLPKRRWYPALFMTVLRKQYVRKYVTNVIWKLQLLLLQVLMLFAHKFVFNKNMKVNTGQKVMRHIVIFFPVSQKESVLMLL